MAHTEDEPLAECLERWRRFDKHEGESIPIRDSVKTHAVQIQMLVDKFGEIASIRNSMFGIVFAIVLQIGSFVYMWGQLTKIVEINSGRITAIEELHPRMVK
jgi:hypothetical protein